MKKHFRFHTRYFTLFLLLLLTEILIALYVHDAIIRPYVGDLLVVILIYCFVRAFFRFSVKATALGVLLFAFFIEILQYFQIVYHLGLEHSRLARTLIGTSFEWIDLLAYFAGYVVILLVEAHPTMSDN